jgi:hypothetical protein
MSRTITEITYNKIEDLYNDILGVKGILLNEFTSCSGNQYYNKYIFRGESSINNRLIPCALRVDNMKNVCELSGLISPSQGINTALEQIDCEEQILKRFYGKCDDKGLKVPSIERLRPINIPARFFQDFDYKWIPNDFYELAGLAQHYGIPTRLLDWSFNFFIAMYFALKGAKLEDEYCSIWAFNYVDFRGYFNHKPNELAVIVPEYSQNLNLKAQQGVFTHWQITKYGTDLASKPVDRRSLDELFESQICFEENEDYSRMFYKINIPIKFSKELYKYLTVVGYDGSTLFPGYGGIARSLFEDAIHIDNYRIKD